MNALSQKNPGPNLITNKFHQKFEKKHYLKKFQRIEREKGQIFTEIFQIIYLLSPPVREHNAHPVLHIGCGLDSVPHVQSIEH